MGDRKQSDDAKRKGVEDRSDLGIVAADTRGRRQNGTGARLAPDAPDARRAQAPGGHIVVVAASREKKGKREEKEGMGPFMQLKIVGLKLKRTRYIIHGRYVRYV